MNLKNEKLTKKINNLNNLERLPAEELFHYLPLDKDDQLLDLGAGTGYISLPAAKHVNTVTALDFDVDILNYLARKAKEEGITNLKTVASDFKNIQMDNETFDKALTSIALHEVKPLSVALNEIYRVLKNKGQFLCLELEETEHSSGPRVSSKAMKQTILEAGFDQIEIFYPETKIVNESVYIIVAQKNQ